MYFFVPSDEKSASMYAGRWVAVATEAEEVRQRPRMYFGLRRTDPALPGAIARIVAAEPFGWSHDPVDVELHVDANLTFTVTDNGAIPCARGVPLLDRNGCLLDRRRWALAAAAAVSRRATVEVHVSGRRWRQTLTGTEPDGAPEDRGACDGTLTRITFELDAGYFGADAALPADTDYLWPSDGVRKTRGTFTVTDLRRAA
jgi:DNA gyrase/topoisomerase IV subunit B